MIVVDRTLDDATATAVAVAPSADCPADALDMAIGLLQAAGLDVFVVDDVPGLIVTRTVAMLANLAADAVAGRVASAADIDTAMRLGVNYPRGPLAWAGQWGLRTVLATLDELESWYRDGHYRASPLLRRAATDERRAGMSTIEVRDEGHVRWIGLNRPDKRNAIDQAMSEELAAALDDARRQPCVLIVHSTTPGIFAAGADIAELRDRDADAALLAINAGLFERLEAHRWPTIALVDGAALGGGCELALACDFRLATERAVFGQPELSLGILAGAGANWRGAWRSWPASAPPAACSTPGPASPPPRRCGRGSWTRSRPTSPRPAGTWRGRSRSAPGGPWS